MRCDFFHSLIVREVYATIRVDGGASIKDDYHDIDAVIISSYSYLFPPIASIKLTNTLIADEETRHVGFTMASSLADRGFVVIG